MSPAAADTSLDRLVRILGAFDAATPELTVAGLARRAALPLPTAYRWVDRLVRAELLERREGGTVRPGLRLWEMASRGAPSTSLSHAAMPFLLDVQAVLRQNTQLAVLDDDGVLVLERLASQGAVVNRATVAGRLPAFTTSLGLVLLAFAPPGEGERFVRRHRELLGRPAEQGRPPAPTEEGLRRLLAQVRREGYAALDGATDADTRGVAVPVRRGRGQAPAALGVVLPRGAESLAGLPALLMTAARGIARAVGGEAPPRGVAEGGAGAGSAAVGILTE